MGFRTRRRLSPVQDRTVPYFAPGKYRGEKFSRTNSFAAPSRTGETCAVFGNPLLYLYYVHAHDKCLQFSVCAMF